MLKTVLDLKISGFFVVLFSLLKINRTLYLSLQQVFSLYS